MLKKVNKATLMATEIAPKAGCICKAVCYAPSSNRSNYYAQNKQLVAMLHNESGQIQ